MFDKNRFRAQLALNGMTLRDLASHLQMNESTLYRKINADGNFSREEINRMIVILRIEDPKSIFFADELA